MHEPFRKFRLIVTILLVFEVLLGAAIIAFTAVYQHILGSFMTERENKILSTKFFNTYILGFQLMATYMCSISMWKSVWLRRYSMSIQLLVSIWLFFCFLIVVCGCATIWSLLDSVEVLSENVAMMMFKGIDVYYMNPEWKFLWDQLQYSRECCGVNGYDDWMRASWMPAAVEAPIRPIMYRYADYVNDANDDYPKVRVITDCIGRKHPSSVEEPPSTPTTSGEISPTGTSERREEEHTLAPYACCRHDSLSCYQNYIPKPDGSESISQLNITEISTRGCLPLFKEYLWCVLNILLFLMVAAIAIDVLICCFTKFLMIRNGMHSYRELENDVSFVDDDGNALVVIRCPPKVKCITLEESNAYDSDIPNICSDTEPCLCCFDDYDGSRNHRTERPSPCHRNDVIVH